MWAVNLFFGRRAGFELSASPQLLGCRVLRSSSLLCLGGGSPQTVRRRLLVDRIYRIYLKVCLHPLFRWGKIAGH